MLIMGQPSERGQAMVEFALMLIVFMAVCTGMLYLNRLLNIQFWAQQEARFIAFEQTWAPRSYYGGYGPAVEKTITGGEELHRPRIINQLDKTDNVTDDGGLPDLISQADQLRSPLRRRADETVMLARNSIWHEHSSAWLARNRRLSEFVSTAFASENMETDGQLRAQVRPPNPPVSPEGVLEDNLIPVQQGFERIFDTSGFGERFCAKAAVVAKAHGRRGLIGASCARAVTQGFSAHLARTADFPEIYREIGFQLQSGFEADDAVEIAFEKAVAQGFYSFFDHAVVAGYALGDEAIDDAEVDAATVLGSAEYSTLSSELRYIGSTEAIKSIGSALNSVSGGAKDRHPFQQQQFEKGLNDILHAEAGESKFLLPVSWLPIPPTLKPVFGNLFNGVMSNVLSNEPALEAALVEDSNRSVLVTYNSEDAFSQPYRRRFNVGHNIRSRFYLVTEPWHITRRVSANGDYRDLGDQDDSMDDDTEEGILRRRVTGLYLFPSHMFAMLSPITGLIPGIDSVTSVLQGVDGIIGDVKSFVLDNPLQDAAYWLQELPVLNTIDFTLPRWPAVRPQAYPATTEIQGDLLTTSSRNFQDYIKEQEDNDPPPNPEYHDD